MAKGQPQIFSKKTIRRKKWKKSIDRFQAELDRHNYYASKGDRSRQRARWIGHRERTSLHIKRKHALKRLNVSYGDLFPLNAQAISNTRGRQVVFRDKSGFYRTTNDGKTERFDLAGRLIGSSNSSGYSINIIRDGSGLIRRIKSNNGQLLLFFWNKNGHVNRIEAPLTNQVVRYSYKGRNLVRSEDMQGNVYKHDYDSRYNMTAIDYQDGDRLSISYDDKTSFATRVVSRNKDVTDYEYFDLDVSGENNKSVDLDPITNRYGTRVKTTDADGDVNTNLYQYESATRANGASYTSQILRKIRGRTTTTWYNRDGLPLKIKRGDNWTSFKYNKRGLMSEKLNNRGDFTKLQYNSRFNKISRVENNEGWTEFAYHPINGDLVHAKNNKGENASLKYNQKKQITKMSGKKAQSDDRYTLTFKYNELGKPVHIAIVGLGAIEVEYDSQGEITNVESKSGHAMALQVTQAFQSLLKLVKPAGVNLNM